MSPRTPLPRLPTVATVLAAVLVALPLLGSAPQPGAELTVVVLAAGLAALTAVATTSVALAPVLVVVPPDDDRPLPRGRATDTPHHPQAPRAPGRR